MKRGYYVQMKFLTTSFLFGNWLFIPLAELKGNRYYLNYNIKFLRITSDIKILLKNLFGRPTIFFRKIDFNKIIHHIVIKI